MELTCDEASKSCHKMRPACSLQSTSQGISDPSNICQGGSSHGSKTQSYEGESGGSKLTQAQQPTGAACQVNKSHGIRTPQGIGSQGSPAVQGNPGSSASQATVGHI